MKLVLQEKKNFLQTQDKHKKNSMQYETLSDDTNGDIAA
jgi:hypothetical protein